MAKIKIFWGDRILKRGVQDTIRRCEREEFLYPMTDSDERGMVTYYETWVIIKGVAVIVTRYEGETFWTKRPGWWDVEGA